MKRFQFRLERLLRLRQQKERLAELKQLQARAVWDAAERDAQQLRDRLAQSAATIEARIGRPVDAVVWLAQYQHMTQLRQTLDTAERNSTRTKALLDQANHIRRTAAAQVEALQSIRQNQWHEHRSEAARAEQQRLDEMCLNRWPRVESGEVRASEELRASECK